MIATAKIEPDIDKATVVFPDSFFRDEYGKLISILVRQFGIENLQLAEDSVQEALLRALKTWPFLGSSPNPSAWLAQTAKNFAIDAIRRDSNLKKKFPDVLASASQWSISDPNFAEEIDEAEIKDSTLRMIFACCHPSISVESQIALALKTLCGFSTLEIANGFLVPVATIEKRLIRARNKLKSEQVSLELSSQSDIEERMKGVLQTLYLLFSEGYKASTGDQLVRNDLCEEAIRLAKMVIEFDAGNIPTAHALLALMILIHSRKSGRTDSEGNILILQVQDRKLWDQKQIEIGLNHLTNSMKGPELTRFHLEAGIAACHCVAPSFQDTNWQQILFLYNQLVKLDHSPILAINRAVALAQVYGPKRGLEEIDLIENADDYYGKHAVKAEFQMLLCDLASASKSLDRATELATLPLEKDFLSKKRYAMIDRLRLPPKSDIKHKFKD